MCTSPDVNVENIKPAETIATPTAADASVTKAGADKRRRIAQNSGRDVKTSARGELEEANTKKKKLLGE